MSQSFSELLAQAPLWYVAFLFSTVCHEAAHALVAKWGGDLTAYSGGQVSLDPMPHIKREPFGLVVIPILSLISFGGMVGWGSAPYNPYWEIRYPRRAALMALAGPVTNFLIAIVAALLIRIGMSTEVFTLGAGNSLVHLIGATGGTYFEGLATFLNILFVLNVLLGVFNLLPIPPLDGCSVLGLFLPEELALKLIGLARTPGFSMIGFIVAWQLFPALANYVIPYSVMLLLYGLL